MTCDSEHVDENSCISGESCISLFMTKYLPKPCGCDSCLKKILREKIISNIEIIEKYLLKIRTLEKRNAESKIQIKELCDFIESQKLLFLTYPECQRRSESLILAFKNAEDKAKCEIRSLKKSIEKNECLIKSFKLNIDVLKATIKQENYAYRHLEC